MSVQDVVDQTITMSVNSTEEGEEEISPFLVFLALIVIVVIGFFAWRRK